MATKKIDLQKYHTAIILVKNACFSSNPIKRTEFIAKHELTPTFFRVMEDLKIIKETSANNFTGSVFSWEYKQASNEADSKVTLLITERIQEINRAAYIKYSSPEHKARKKTPVTTSAIRRTKKIKDDIWDGPSVLIKEGPSIMIEIPESEVAVEDFLGNPTIQETPVDTISQATKISFEFVGKYQRQDLINKILALVDEKAITSFNLAVTYN